MSRPARRALAAVLLAAIGCSSFTALVLVPQSPAHAADEKTPRATFEVYQDRGGEYRWRLRSLNKQILATSGEGYKQKRDCLSAIDSVKRSAPDAPVEDQPAPASR